jgi:hypothetical protein
VDHKVSFCENRPSFPSRSVSSLLEIEATVCENFGSVEFSHNCHSSFPFHPPFPPVPPLSPTHFC